MPDRIAIELDVLLARTSEDRPGLGSDGVFWDGRDESEPRILSRLAEISAARRWEIIFLTTHAHSSRGTSQADAQRWLESKGFALPSVYVTRGSRGRIASALQLDIVVGANRENCAEVAAESTARAILVWPADRNPQSAGLPKPEFEVVTSVGACLDMLTAAGGPVPRTTGLPAWVRRLLGLKEA